MSLENYEYVLQNLNHPKWGNVFQVALGGGEPLEHPDFLDMIDVSLDHRVIPNFTTNGIHLSAEIIKAIEGKVGAVALSTYNLDTLPNHTLELLRRSSVRTNLHFLLSSKSIKQAVQILEGRFNSLFSDLNAIIFLTYKPAGRAKPCDCLQWDDNLRAFVQLVDNSRCSIRIGFDACFIPLLLHTTRTSPVLIDPCECAFFSVYVDEGLNVKPCSFANNDDFTFNMEKYTFQEIWEVKFVEYREKARNECLRSCKGHNLCRGRCQFFDEINICYSNSIKESLLS
jgi:radical SAM protein with 4Fe4S-binding SPASM domain